MGFGQLRVLNEDWIAGEGGFPPHPHHDMEIITYVISGALAHEDSTGGKGVIKPDELQVMTAGTGITHSEFNASATEQVHLLQLWLLPKAKGLTPRYDQRRFDPPQGWQHLASPTGTDGTMQINTPAHLWRARPAAGEALAALPAPQGAWLQVIKGTVKIGPHILQAGDALAQTGGTLELHAETEAEVLAILMA